MRVNFGKNNILTFYDTLFTYKFLGENMTIKSDKWIRKMAEEKEMISPFEPKMVRDLDGTENCILWDIKLWL